jgi:hypothetical protein
MSFFVSTVTFMLNHVRLCTFKSVIPSSKWRSAFSKRRVRYAMTKKLKVCGTLVLLLTSEYSEELRRMRVEKRRMTGLVFLSFQKMVGMTN